MSEEGKKDSGFVGLVGGAAAGVGAGFGINKMHKDSLIKDALAVTEEAPGKFAEGARKTFADTVKRAHPKMLEDVAAAGTDKKAMKEAVKVFNKEVKEVGGGFFKNMSIVQKGTLIAGAVVAAVVGKKLLDAVIGTRQEGGHVAALEAESAKEASVSR